MAVEKGKVLSAIEAKLKGKSLSKNFKDNLASKWADKIEKDDDIDAYIEDREDILIEASSEADRRAVAAAKKAKEEKEKKEEEAEEEIEIDNDAPKWAKALIKQNQVLASEIETFKMQQKSQTIQERFKNDDRIKSLKGVQEHMFKGRIPQNEEEYEASIEEFVNDWKPFLEKNVLSDEGKDTPPSGMGGKPKGEVKKISPEEAKATVAAMGSN